MSILIVLFLNAFDLLDKFIRVYACGFVQRQYILSPPVTLTLCGLPLSLCAS